MMTIRGKRTIATARLRRKKALTLAAVQVVSADFKISAQHLEAVQAMLGIFSSRFSVEHLEEVEEEVEEEEEVRIPSLKVEADSGPCAVTISRQRLH
jgi:hypothetical protein